MLDDNVTDVPQDKRHRSACLRASPFCFIPAVTAAVDAACPVAVDANPLAGQNEACLVILEGNGIPAATPVGEVCRELRRRVELAFAVPLLVRSRV